MREVGKPVSTTREPPRFGDWRSATIWENRVTLALFFFHGNGMVVLVCLCCERKREREREIKTKKRGRKEGLKVEKTQMDGTEMGYYGLGVEHCL